jgi:hypothetical protein
MARVVQGSAAGRRRRLCALGLPVMLAAWPVGAGAQPASQPAASARASQAAASMDSPAWLPSTPASTPEKDFRWRSRRTARLLAVGSTLAPMLLGGVLALHAGLSSGNEGEGWAAATIGALGLTLGPGIGHYYAGEYRNPTLRILLRTVLAVAGGALLLLGWIDYFGTAMANLFGHIEDVPQNADLKILGGAFLVAGAVGLALYDCYDAGRAADRMNAAHQRRRAFVTPFVARSNGATRYGLALASTF